MTGVIIPTESDVYQSPTHPDAPTTLFVEELNDNSFNLTWTNNGGTSAKTELWRSIDHGVNYILVVTSADNGSSYHDTGLEWGTIYYYKARALLSGAYSGFCSPEQGKTVGAP